MLFELDGVGKIIVIFILQIRILKLEEVKEFVKFSFLGSGLIVKRKLVLKKWSEFVGLKINVDKIRRMDWERFLFF